MRVIDLRLKTKRRIVAEGVVSSIKLTELENGTEIEVSLDKGYSIAIPMSEFNIILDYINSNNITPSKKENTVLNAEKELEPKPDLSIQKEKGFSIKPCPICGSAMEVISREPFVISCSNSKCSNHVNASDFE
jgi:hypothetical protein